MLQETKAGILDNQFVSRLRMELAVDEGEYEKLLAALKVLASQWQSLKKIAKKLMQELYVLASITRNMAPEISGESSQIEEMATAIDALVLDCLA